MVVSYENAMLDALAPSLEEQGYQLLRQPPPSMVPGFLRGFQPDAIAVGRAPQLVIEITRGGDASAEKVKRLQQAVELHPDWQLRVILDRSDESPILAPLLREDIETALRTMKSVAAGGSDGAALLIGWAALEGIARRLDPDRFAKPRSAGHVVEVLASLGHLLPNEAEVLRSLAQRRNRLAHGQVNEPISHAEVMDFATILDNLAAAGTPH